MDPEQERETEAKVRKERDAGLEAETLSAGVIGGIPLDKSLPFEVRQEMALQWEIYPALFRYYFWRIKKNIAGYETNLN